MFLLKKVFQLRDQANPDQEKPFLEHLEDLRVTITRMVITLLVSVIACFGFQKQLMHVLRKPVEEVRYLHATKSLPENIPLDLWEKAKQAERAAQTLPEPLREPFLNAHPEAVRSLAEKIPLLRAALTLPEADQQAFLLAHSSPETTEFVLELIKLKANPEIDSRGNISLMSALKPTETFMLSMKLSFFAGIVVAFPLLLLFLLQFILPGLHRNERRVLWPALAIGFGLFLAGVVFAYFYVLPRALAFFYQWGGDLGISNDWRIGEYITFATQFTLLFGLSFELPVVVMVLVKLGLISYDVMSRTRSYAIVAITIIAAVITPTPDAFTLGLMAIPMIILYEICIWFAWFDARKQKRLEEEEERQRMERLLTGLDASSTEEGETEDRGDSLPEDLENDSDDHRSSSTEEPDPDDAPTLRPTRSPHLPDPEEQAELADLYHEQSRLNHLDPPAEDAPETASPSSPAETGDDDDTPPESIPGEEARRMADPGPSATDDDARKDP